MLALLTLRKALRSGLVVLILCLGPQGAHAAALVLVHGYLCDGDIWYDSGITGALERAGWQDGGRLKYVSGIARLTGVRPYGGRKVFYTVNLPSEAPLLQQSSLLTEYLHIVQRDHKGEELVLVGHSAGGLVARLTMVQHPEIKVTALITIAAPNLGTDSAEIGLMAEASPLGMFAPLLGIDTLSKSRRLYTDLVRERPGTLLYWLNHQRHPDARYISIVRDDSVSLGDFIVPAYSQDMDNVYALRGRVQTVSAPGEHALGPADGRLLVRLIKQVVG